MKAIGVRINGVTVGVVKVPHGTSVREVARIAFRDCPVAGGAKPMVSNTHVGAFVVDLTVAEA